MRSERVTAVGKFTRSFHRSIDGLYTLYIQLEFNKKNNMNSFISIGDLGNLTSINCTGSRTIKSKVRTSHAGMLE